MNTGLWLDSWTEWQTPSLSSPSSTSSSSSSYTANTPLPASDDSSFPSPAPPTLTLDPYSPTDLSYLSPPLSLCYSPSGSDCSTSPSTLDTPPPPLTPIQALSFPDFDFDSAQAVCGAVQAPGAHFHPGLSIGSPSTVAPPCHAYHPFPSVVEGSYAPPGCDNMLGLDWSYYSCLPPSQVIPSFAPTPTAPTPAVPARNYVDQDGPSDLSPVPFNGSSIEAVYPSPDALIGFPHRIQRVTRARKSASSTTRSARHTLPSSTSPSLSTPTTSFSSASSIKTYKPRRALGTGTPNFTSTTPCDTSYLCTTCHATYPLTRSSDFTRHVLTHYPEYRGGALLCCGVPLDSPQYLAMMAEGMIPPDAPVRRYYGRWMVGGCGLLCARTDVLRKHLGNGRKGCVGDLTGDWHPPKLPRAGS